MKTSEYQTLWKTVENFEKKGLPESAKKIVNEIYTKARSEKNAQELVKAVIHIMKFTEYKEEDSFIKNLHTIEEEIKTASFPVKPLLHSMLAEAYWNYYQSHRWNFRQRTQTVNFKNDDIATWSLEQIIAATIKNYQLSLEDAEKSKNTRIDIYEEVLVPGNKKGREIRPTLFDFLAHRAIDLFISDEPDITKPAYAFVINSANYLSDAETFSKLNISSKDSLAYKYYALKILQDLIRFHLKDEKKDALVDVDLKRLNFVNQHLTLSNKQDLFLNALLHLEQQTINLPVSTIVTYNIALVWAEKGGLYKPLQSADHKWDIKKAYDICDLAIKRFPESDGAIMAENFRKSLLTKTVSAETEKINVTGQPFRALVNFKNFTNLYWRITKVTKEEVNAERKKWLKNYDVNREEKFIEYFAAKTPEKTGTVKLPNVGDLQQHSAEIKIEGVPEGDYMVLFSANQEFSVKSNSISYSFTTISNLSYINRNSEDASTDLYVLNRTSGEPVQNAKVQIFLNEYNTKTNSYEIVSGGNFITDKEGYVKIPYQNKKLPYGRRNNFYIDIQYNSDKISTQNIDNYDYYYYSGILSQFPEPIADTVPRTIFFLDRAIYRPGQTLYFKGLSYLSNPKNPKILKKKNIHITFYDVNQQVVAEKSFVTNEYGTFNGTFTTPSAGLMGQMHLQADDSQSSAVYFSVEEYKRPKFEVKFNPVKESFRLGDSIKVSGKALAYSGANIDGASVKYRIVRQARFPYWWWCWFGYYPPSPEVEITNGTTNTDAEGNFDVSFPAIPDESVDKKSDPRFDYIVYADVTDVNGETHSNKTTISVGYKSLILGVQIDDVDVSSGDALKKKHAIQTTNLAGEFQPAKGTIKIWKLKSPVRTFRSRLWTRPDTFIMSREEYYKNFPYDLYDEETNYFKWEKEKESFVYNFNTSNEKDFLLKDLDKWDLGKYLLQITSKDKFGEDVKEVAYFEVFNSQSKTLSIPAVHHLRNLKQQGEPGEKALIQVGTSEKTSTLYEIELDGKIILKQRLNLNNEKRILEIPLKEEYRGNITAHYVFVKNNRLYKESSLINVPYSNKELDIKFETFRDKLQPGQQEQWKLKIQGKKAEKVMAEMVASLYDASLDVFRANYWSAEFYQYMYTRRTWNSLNGFEPVPFKVFDAYWNRFKTKDYSAPYFDALNWFGVSLADNNDYDYLVRRSVSASGRVSKSLKYTPPIIKMDEEVTKDGEMKPIVLMSESIAVKEVGQSSEINQEKPKVELGNVKVRKNFNETAFFFPNLQTNEKGEIIINFTIPEALTRWKMMGFAHTQDLKSGFVYNELVTQKDVMVVPNQPRFFRENDKMTFSVKINSLVDKELAGEAKLEFFDALTMKPLNDLMQNQDAQKPFSLKAKQSAAIEWNIEIPEGIQAIMYRVVARAENFSDGEEMVLPVVTNRMMVTETLPLPIRGKQSKTFRFEKLLNNTSTTLKSNRYTLEFTSNPAWYAIQALSYLMEYPYECTEQTFSRFYANSIASHIANSNPKIKRVFDTWATIQPDALLSNLEKNQELKTALLEETPWVLNAKDESQRKRNVALLFDLNKMSNELERALKKIMEAQTGNGGFSWFPGLPEDRYITQHIVAGMGHLDVMGVNSVRKDSRTWEMITKALFYLDARMSERYEYLKSEARKHSIKLEEYNPDYTEIHYLYTRSYFRDVAIENDFREGYNYFLEQIKKYWTKNSVYMQGMVALALQRSGEKAVPAAIIKSLRERALQSEEMGMYWKYDKGYFWYQAPIETQALMIEVFDEVAADKKAVEDLKVWLLKQKQTQDWFTTKATSEACYALLRRGADALASDSLVEIKIGDEIIDPAKRSDTKVEAGTGYFKTAWTAPEITSKMGNIQVTKKDEGVAWGAIYWQYFEQLDKITTAETPLKLKKELFLQQNTDHGPVITPINENAELHVGDLIKVRIELRVDRTMEYIHLKDMRAAAFEPVETISGYKFQDGLWYYESPRDLATNFFIGWLPKGTYVFEYPLRVSQKGNFSNGITTIQCMYAPEFSSHSEGIRVDVK